MFDEFLRLLFKSLFFLSHSTITNSTILRIVFKKQTHTTSIEYWLNCTCTTSKLISCECPAPSICIGRFCTVFGLLYVILILRSNAVNYQCFWRWFSKATEKTLCESRKWFVIKTEKTCIRVVVKSIDCTNKFNHTNSIECIYWMTTTKFITDWFKVQWYDTRHA